MTEPKPLNAKAIADVFEAMHRDKVKNQAKDFNDLRAMEKALGTVVGHLLKRNNEYAHPYIDVRQASIAKTHFEEGFRALYVGLGATIVPPKE